MGQLPSEAPKALWENGWKDRELEDGEESSGILPFRHHTCDVNFSSRQPCLDMRTQDKTIRRPIKGLNAGNHMYSPSLSSHESLVVLWVVVAP